MKFPPVHLAFAFFSAITVQLAPTHGAVANVRSGNSDTEFTELMLWAQQVSAAQQPLLQVFEGCKPKIEKASEALSTKIFDTELMQSLQTCVENLEEQVIKTRAKTLSLGRLPVTIEREFGINSEEFLAANAAVYDSLVIAVKAGREGYVALSNGDVVLARDAFARARRGQAGAIEAQLLFFGVVRKTMSSDEPVAALTDARIALARAAQVIALADISAEGVAIGDSLSPIALSAQEAANRLRSKWTAKYREFQQFLRSDNDPVLAERISQLNVAYSQLIVAFDELAGTLNSAPAGSISLREAVDLQMVLGAIEVRVVQISTALAGNVR